MTNPGDSLEKISLAAAMANSYARDQQGFAGLVAALLEGSMPNLVDVERKPIRLFSSEKRVSAVKVALGDEIFELKDAGGKHALVAQKIKIVRGITLKTEQISIDKWLADLDAAVTEYAKSNQHASAAITEYLQSQGL